MLLIDFRSGSNLCRELLNEKLQDTSDAYFIAVLDILSPQSASVKNLPWIQDDSTNRSRFVFYQGDICDGNLVQHIMHRHQINCVINMAACTSVDRSFTHAHTLEFTRTNVLGLHTLLERSLKHGLIKLFMQVSTDEVYGQSETDQDCFTETSPLRPLNPYAATKAAADHLCQSYIQCHKMPIIITRSNNIYGPQQFPDKIIPAFITRLLRGEKCLLHGLGDCRRRYLFVNDLCDAILLLLDRGTLGQIYNIGANDDDEFCNIDIACMLIRKIYSAQNVVETDYIQHVSDRLYNDTRYAMDSSKLRTELGWTPKTSFHDGIQRTIDWYSQNASEEWWNVDKSNSKRQE